MLGVEFTAEHKAQVLNNYYRVIEARRKMRESRKIAEVIDVSSDETFAFIAGYTSGGAPYGITWEQDREFRKQEALLGELLFEGEATIGPEVFLMPLES